MTFSPKVVSLNSSRTTIKYALALAYENTVRKPVSIHVHEILATAKCDLIIFGRISVLSFDISE